MAKKITQQQHDRLESMSLAELAEILDTTPEALQQTYGRAEVAEEQALEAVKRQISNGTIVVE